MRKLRNIVDTLCSTWKIVWIHSAVENKKGYMSYGYINIIPTSPEAARLIAAPIPKLLGISVGCILQEYKRVKNCTPRSWGQSYLAFV